MMKEINLFWFKLAIVVFFMVAAAVSLGMTALEGMPLADSVQWTLMTMTTAGTGASPPETESGRKIAMLGVYGGGGALVGMFVSLLHVGAGYRKYLHRQWKARHSKRLFFNEMGVDLLRQIANQDVGVKRLQRILQISPEWKRHDFESALDVVTDRRHPIDSHLGDLAALRDTLQDGTGLLVRLLEDPVVRGSDTMSALIASVSRLRTELDNRADLKEMSPSDRGRLDRAILETYELLLIEWIRYIQLLKPSSSGHFSEAVRSNPFVAEAP